MISRVQEVRASIAHLLGCHENELDRGMNSRVLVTHSMDLQKLWHEINGEGYKAAPWPSFQQSLGLTDQWQRVESARLRVAVIERDLKNDFQKRLNSGALYKTRGEAACWMLCEPQVQGASDGTWQISVFTESGSGRVEFFDSREEAQAHLRARGCQLVDGVEFLRIVSLPPFVRTSFSRTLRRQVEERTLSPQQARIAIDQFDADLALVVDVSSQVAQGLYLPGVDKIVLVADQIPRGNEQAVYLHEAVHKHARWVLGDMGFDRLVSTVLSWSDRAGHEIERAIYQAAHERAQVADSTRKALYREELLAYAIEEAVARGVKPGALAHEADAQAWLADVVMTFQGVRDQLLGQGPGLSLQQVVDMAYAMAQLDSPARSEQLRQALRHAGMDEEFLSALQVHAERYVLAGVDGNLVSTISRTFQTEEFADLGHTEPDSDGAGPFGEGSVSYALSLWDFAGRGGIVRIVSDHSPAEHYGLEIEGLIYDFDGVHPSEQSWIETYTLFAGDGPKTGLRCERGLLGEAAVHSPLREEVGRLLRANSHLEVGDRFLEDEEADLSIGAPLNLPDCKIAGPLAKLNEDADYRLAKSGDVDAAVRCAVKFVTPELVAAVKDQLSGDHSRGALLVIGVSSLEASGYNAAPQAAARVLANAMGCDVDTEIVQSTSPMRTSKSGLDRVFSRPTFDGRVRSGCRYILVDDTITQGGTFAALSEHIEAGGGRVVAVAALSGKNYSAKLAPSAVLLDDLRDKFGDLEDDFAKATGRRYARLTESEARCLATFRPAAAVRDRIAQEARQAARRADQESPRQGLNRPFEALGGDFASALKSFAGQKAQNSDPFSLATAQHRLARGDDRDLVRQDTGWFLGPEGKWRFEIDDSKSRLLIAGMGLDFKSNMPPGVVLVGDILSHERLFAAYPSLAQLQVQTQPGRDCSFQSWLPRGSVVHEFRVCIGEQLGLAEARSALLHELQHAVQTIESFASGGNIARYQDRDVTEEHVRPLNEQIMQLLDANPEFGRLRREQNRDFSSILDAWGRVDDQGRSRLNWDDVPQDRRGAYMARMELLGTFAENDQYIDLDIERKRLLDHRRVLSAWDQYERQAGEVEARLVQARRYLSDQARLARAPWAQQDVLPADVIVTFNGLQGALRPLPANAVMPGDSQDTAQSGSLVLSALIDRQPVVIAPLRWEAMGSAALGDWVELDYRDLRGTPVAQVQDLDVHDLYLPELTEDGALQPEKGAYLEPYVARLHAGEAPPVIHVIEMEDRRLRVVDGHRRVMAARACGHKNIRALVSLLVPTAEGLVPATVELINRNGVGDQPAFEMVNGRLAKVASAPPAILPTAVFSEDIPNEDWLRGKRAYAAAQPRSAYGVPAMYVVTGRFSGPVYVPTRWFDGIRGQRGEQENVRSEDLAAIKSVMQETRRFPLLGESEYVPYVEIGLNGVPWISDGNHRLMAALELGPSYVPVNLRYFEGGQLFAGKWAPQNILEIQQSDLVAREVLRRHAGGGETPARLQRAFHGSPHSGITRFSTFKVGTGEGAQSYGWGLYFAESKDVADWYRKELSVEEQFVNGELFDSDKPEHFLALALWQESGDASLARDFLEAMARPGGAVSVRRSASAALTLLNEGARPSLQTVKPDGQLYEVAIPEDSEMLLWDKSLEQQPQKVGALVPALVDAALARYKEGMQAQAAQAAKPSSEPVSEDLAALLDDPEFLALADSALSYADAERQRIYKAVSFMRDNFAVTTGQGFYKELAGIYGSDKAASEVLSGAGIKGIKYLDGTSRASGEGSYNYVMFDGDDVEVLRTFYSFVGSKSGHAGSQELCQARQRVVAGEDPDRVRRDTGWFTGADGLWRYEISDQGARVNEPMLHNLATGGWGAFKAREVSYRKEADGTWTLVVVPINAQSPGEIASLRAVPQDMLSLLLPDEIVRQIHLGLGEEDFVGNFLDARAIRQEFAFAGFNAIPLGEVLYHPKLFEACPYLHDVHVQVHPSDGNGASLLRHRDSYDRLVSRIRMGPGVLRHQLVLSVILHEVQHVIQFDEGFAPGGSVEKIDQVMRKRSELNTHFECALAQLAEATDEVARGNAGQMVTYYGLKMASTGAFRGLTSHEGYHCLAGEVEARNVQTRMDWNDEQRRTTSPAESASVPIDEQIIHEAEGDKWTRAHFLKMRA